MDVLAAPTMDDLEAGKERAGIFRPSFLRAHYDDSIVVSDSMHLSPQRFHLDAVGLCSRALPSRSSLLADGGDNAGWLRMGEIAGFRFENKLMIPLEAKEGATYFWDDEFTCPACGKRNHVQIVGCGFLKCGYCGADVGVCAV